MGSRFTEFQYQRYVSRVEMVDCIETDGSVSLEFMNPMKFGFFSNEIRFRGTLVFDIEGLENGYLKHGNVVIGLIEMIRDG